MGCIHRSPPMPFVMNVPICFQVVCLFADLYVGMCTMACVWKSENNSAIVIFFHPVGHKKCTQVHKLSGKYVPFFPF